MHHVHAIYPELHPTIKESNGNALEIIEEGGISIEYTTPTKPNIWPLYE
jgi:hypothetical protein